MAFVSVGGLALTVGCAVVAGLDEYDVVACPDGCDAAVTRTDASSPLSDGATQPVVDAGARDAIATPADSSTEAGIDPLCDPNDPSLVLCLPFEGNVLDGAGDAGAVATAVTFGPGHVGQAAFFDGVSSGVGVPPSPELDSMKRMTLEAFLIPSALPAGNMRAGILDADGRFGIFLVSTGFVCTNSQATAVTTNVPLTIGKLTHVACTRDGATLTAFQDGVPVGSALAPGALTATPTFIGIGRNEPAGDHYSGVIDELRVYSEARSAAQIMDDSARGR